MAKRPRESQDDGSSQAGAAEAARRKKSRTSGVAILAPSVAAAPVKPTKDKRKSKKSLVEPPKRPRIPGTLNRLAVAKPQSLAARAGGSGSTRADVNRRGNKINKGWGTGGFDTAAVDAGEQEDLGKIVQDDSQAKKQSGGKSAPPVGAELWVTRKTSYSAYLKSGVAAFVHKGHHTLVLRALGAAIPVCLSLAMAVRDALPCGDDGVTMDIRTGSVDVNDEIVPEDGPDAEDEDIQYQTRTKSSIECTLTLKKSIRQKLLVQSQGVSGRDALGAKPMGVRPGRGGRGKPMRGRGGGRHAGIGHR